MEAKTAKSTTFRKVLRALLDQALRNANHGHRRRSGRSRKSSHFSKLAFGKFLQWTKLPSTHIDARALVPTRRQLMTANSFLQRRLRPKCVGEVGPWRSLHAPNSILSRRGRDGTMEQVSTDHGRSFQLRAKSDKRFQHPTSVELSVIYVW